MADQSPIEWTEATWNPIAGCSVVSPGCTNCYAMRRVAPRLAANPATPHYAGTVMPSKAGPVWTGKIGIASDRVLTAPLRWRAPRTVFVNSMSDLFHEDVPDAVIDRVFAVMALSPQHTFQVLTKRSARMRAYCDNRGGGVSKRISMIATDTLVRWPLPNVWLGVSAERQQEADERVPDLLATPAAIRFVSAEPLLGPIDLNTIELRRFGSLPNEMSQRLGDYVLPLRGAFTDSPKIDWVITGFESGNGARPGHPDWARSIRDQCAAASVAYFHKQNGVWRVVYDRDRDDPDWRRCDAVAAETPQGRWLNLAGGHGFHGERLVRVVPATKKVAGRLLDGVEHNGFPTTHL